MPRILCRMELDVRDRMRYAEVKECGADNGQDNR